jgi:hypothetical protein
MKPGAPSLKFSRMHKCVSRFCMRTIAPRTQRRPYARGLPLHPARAISFQSVV